MKTIGSRVCLNLAVALLLLLLAGFVWAATQPRYAGRKAPEWFQAALNSDRVQLAYSGGVQETVRFREALEAFRHMGNRGTRWLVNKYVQRTPAYLDWYDQIALRLRGVIRLPPRRQPNRLLENAIAHRMLLRLGHAAAPELIRKTRSRQAQVRARALTVLGELGPGYPEAQARLFQLLSDRSTEVVYGSLEVLWMTLPEPTTTLPKILPFLSHTNDRVRVEATYCIGCMAPVPERGILALVQVLSDPAGTVRANAARAIGLSSNRSEVVLAPLEQLLDDSNAVTRFRAAEALGRLLGGDALIRTPRLLEVVEEAEQSPGEYFRVIGFNARAAMEEPVLGRQSTIDTFRQLSSSSLAYMRYEVVEALGSGFQARRTPAPPGIRALLVVARSDPNGMIRQRATETLRLIEP